MDRGGLWHVKYTTEDVQFYWLIATTDFNIDDKETHQLLLTKIVPRTVYIKSFFKNWSLDGKV